MASEKKAVFFDSYDDYKIISDTVESQNGEFVACWPPPRPDKSSKRKRSSDDSSSDEGEDEGESEEEPSRPRNTTGNIQGGDSSDEDIVDDTVSDVPVTSSPQQPSELERATAASSEPTSSWQAVQDPTSGDFYYWNTVSGETTWETPADLVSSTSTEEMTKKPERADKTDSIVPEKEHADGDGRPDTEVSNRNVVEEELEEWTLGAERWKDPDLLPMKEPETEQERALIKRTAKFVVDKGKSAEDKLREQKNERFGFLEPEHLFFRYFQFYSDLERLTSL